MQSILDEKECAETIPGAEADPAANEEVSDDDIHEGHPNQILLHPDAKKAITSKIRGVGRVSSQFRNVRELTTLKSDETQIEKDLIQMQEFLGRLIEEQDVFLQAKRDVDGMVRKVVDMIGSDAETSIHMIRIKMEPELEKLSFMINQEIQSYTTIRFHHKSTLAKLGQTVKLIQNESSMRTKLVGKRDKLLHEANKAHHHLGNEVVQKKELEEDVFKLQFQIELLTDLRNKETRDKSRLISANAKMANEIEHLKSLLVEETNARRKHETDMAELKETCNILHAKLKAAMKEKTKKIHHSNHISHEIDDTSNQISPELPQQRFPSVIATPEFSGRPTTAPEPSRTPTRASPTNFHLSERKYNGQIFSNPTFLSEKKKKQKLKYLSKSDSVTSPFPPRNDSSLSSRFSSKLGTHSKSTSKPCPIWPPSLYRFEKPSEFPIITSPAQWILKLSHPSQDMSDQIRSIGAKLQSAVELLTQQRYLSYVNASESAIHNLYKVWQPTKAEFHEVFLQLVWIFYDIFMFYMNQGNIESSHSVLKKMDTLIMNYDDSKSDNLRYLLSNSLALVMFRKEKYTNCLFQLQKSQKYVKDKNHCQLAETHGRISCVFIQMKNTTDSLRNLMLSKRCLEALSSSDPDSPFADPEVNSIGQEERHLTLFEASITLQFNLVLTYHYSRDQSSHNRLAESAHRVLREETERVARQTPYLETLTQQIDALGLLVKVCLITCAEQRLQQDTPVSMMEEEKKRCPREDSTATNITNAPNRAKAGGGAGRGREPGGCRRRDKHGRDRERPAAQAIKQRHPR